MLPEKCIVSLCKRGEQRGILNRRVSKTIHIGSVAIGGGAPVSVQSMTKTDTRDAKATVSKSKSSGIRL